MDKSNLDFNYDQKWKRRVVNDPKLLRFAWPYHGFSTQYSEPFTTVNLTTPNTQGYVPDQTLKPVRTFELDFVGMKHRETAAQVCDPNLSFNRLYEFYELHGLHRRFVYEHPVYGDIIVRFAKPVTIPKKILDGNGSLGTFTVQLIEVVTTYYNFDPTESFDGDFPFPCEYYDVEVDVTDETMAAPLGNNYEMVFKRAKKPLKTFKLTISGMKYIETALSELTIGVEQGLNMALLEAFYLKHRLSATFKFSYAGVEYPVRFKQPLVVPKVYGNNGVMDSLELIFIETPYKVLENPFREADESIPYSSWAYSKAELYEPLLYRRNAVKTNGVDYFDSYSLKNVNTPDILAHIALRYQYAAYDRIFRRSFGDDVYGGYEFYQVGGVWKFRVKLQQRNPNYPVIKFDAFVFYNETNQPNHTNVATALEACRLNAIQYNNEIMGNRGLLFRSDVPAKLRQIGLTPANRAIYACDQLTNRGSYRFDSGRVIEKIDENYTEEYFVTYRYQEFDEMARMIAADAVLRIADAEAIVQATVDNMPLTQADLNQFELNKHLRGT